MESQRSIDKKPVVKKVEFDLSHIKNDVESEVKTQLDTIRKEQTRVFTEFGKQLEKLNTSQTSIPRHNHSEYLVRAEFEKWVQSFVELQDTVTTMVGEFNKLVEVFQGRR
jgi:hypothetical protein